MNYTHTINYKSNIRETIKKIDEGGIGFIVVIDDKANALGVITDGDFRRAVLKEVDLSSKALTIANTNFRYIELGFLKDEAQSIFSEGNIQYLPVLENRKFKEIISEEDLLKSKNIIGSKKNKFNAPVVIMAGGFGTRLEPFTKILPKALIPIDDKPMIEYILDEFASYGIDEFYISVFHKANMIKAFFEDNNYRVNFIQESSPLGTGGALKYLEGKMQTSFFVSNCDIFIKDDYYKIYKYHESNNNMLTIVTSMQHVKVPYGVCRLNKNGDLRKINEKPELDLLINTGIYVLDPAVLKYIPENILFNITDLIDSLLEKNIKIGVYPVSHNSYVDIGQWDKYKNAIKVLST